MFSYNTFNKSSFTNGFHKQSTRNKGRGVKTLLILLASVVALTVVHFAHGVASADSMAKRYIVQPGDTLWSISQKFDHGGDLRDVMAEIEDTNSNGDLNRLYPGQVLEIPGN